MYKNTDTAAYKLFFKKWSVSIPEMFLYSEGHMQRLGTYVTGDVQRDRELALTMVPALIPLAQIAELFEQGARIQLTNPHDAVPMYQLIIEHFNDCQVASEVSVNYKLPPTEDLNKFDNLACELYKTAKIYMASDRPTDGIFGQLDRASIPKKRYRRHVDDHHEPMTPKIEQSLFDRTKRWR